MDQITESPMPLQSRVPAILLKILALAWFLGAIACLGEVIEAIGMCTFEEVFLRTLIYLPPALVPAAVGIGLWLKRRWARTSALLIGWLALSLLILVPFFIYEYESFGLYVLWVVAGPPTTVFVLLQAYFLTRPATKALFGLSLVSSAGALTGGGRSSDQGMPVTERDVPVLIEKLQDEDPQVRGEAAVALGWIGPTAKEAVPALVKALQDENPQVRKDAAVALGWIGPTATEAVPGLIAALQDEMAAVRFTAARVLGDMGTASQGAVLDLRKLLEDEDPDVRRQASLSIQQIGEE